MNIPAVTFKTLIKNLAEQFNKSGHAECVLDDVGTQINQFATQFFSIALIEDDLPEDIAAIGVLCDDSASYTPRNSFTFMIFIDSSKKFQRITDDLKNVLFKLILSHEICHFAFYYELFLNLGADLSVTVFSRFKNIVSGKFMRAITKEKDATSETIVDEHSYREILLNASKYPSTHFSKKNKTDLDYTALFNNFFSYLTDAT